MAEAWNPWRALRAREHLRLRWARLPDGTTGLCDMRAGVVTIDARLDQRHRNATLAHELVHDERRLPTVGVPVELAVKEERAVDYEVARRLVPADELEAFVDRLAGEGEAVTAREVAEHFEVPADVAGRALALLQVARARRAIGNSS